MKEIFERVKQINTSRKSVPKILLHTDAAQAIGKIPVNVQDFGADYLTVVGHKVTGGITVINDTYCIFLHNFFIVAMSMTKVKKYFLI